MTHRDSPDDPEHGFVAFGLAPDFPLQDVHALASVLASSAVCVPGFIPPQVGLYSPVSYLVSHRIDGQRTVLLPDRNVVSRFAQLAQGLTANGDAQRLAAAQLLAFCQCMDIQIEPSIAFHELAQAQGQDAAVAELGWFRAADNGDVFESIDVALGRTPALAARVPAAVTVGDLTHPLARWRRNYVIALKIYELEHALDRPIDRILTLLRWMREDFIFGGPAALFASVYFAPNSPPRRRSFKRKNSTDRELALAGVRNATWDLTHLSEFTRLVNETADAGQTRYLFASFDIQLRRLANLLFRFGTDFAALQDLPAALAQWWPAVDAQRIVDAMTDHIAHLQSAQWTPKTDSRPDFIGELIRFGEAHVRQRDPGLPY